MTFILSLMKKLFPYLKIFKNKNLFSEVQFDFETSCALEVQILSDNKVN
jgi:hypothetical protein